jgi:hypothetical protein
MTRLADNGQHALLSRNLGSRSCWISRVSRVGCFAGLRRVELPVVLWHLLEHHTLTIGRDRRIGE